MRQQPISITYTAAAVAVCKPIAWWSRSCCGKCGSREESETTGIWKFLEGLEVRYSSISDLLQWSHAMILRWFMFQRSQPKSAFTVPSQISPRLALKPWRCWFEDGKHVHIRLSVGMAYGNFFELDQVQVQDIHHILGIRQLWASMFEHVRTAWSSCRMPGHGDSSAAKRLLYCFKLETVPTCHSAKGETNIG